MVLQSLQSTGVCFNLMDKTAKITDGFLSLALRPLAYTPVIPSDFNVTFYGYFL